MMPVIESKNFSDEIFRNFIYTEEEKPFLSELFADYLTNCISTGNLLPSQHLPTVEDMHLGNHLPYHVINAALKILKNRGLILMGRGIKTQVAQKQPVVAAVANTSSPIYCDCYSLPFCNSTAAIKTMYHKTKFYCMSTVPPQYENSICEEMINILCMRFNKLHSMHYSRENILYAHSYYHLMRAIVKAIAVKKGVVVIPKYTDVRLRNALKINGIKVVEIHTDEIGINVTKLASLCTNNNVIGVFLTSAANFSNCKAMSDERIAELYDLQAMYSFKIIENNFYEPWLIDQKNKVLNLTPKPLDNVIYVYPLNYFIKDMSYIRTVAADAFTIARIKEHLIADEVAWQYSIAKAISTVLLVPEYDLAEKKVREHLTEGIATIRRVFTASGFWDLAGIYQDAGMAFILKPKGARFPSDAISRYSAKDIYVCDPKSYQGSVSNGLRTDFSFHMAAKNLEAKVIKFESESRAICIRGKK